MCGIAGYYNIQLTDENKASIANNLAHRGPDACNWYSNNNNTVHFLHRRLSILDLSDAANQPFYSDDGRYVLIYNGEVYNFKELAQQYKIETKTTSDTEVILKLFIQLGKKFIDLLNGMFVIVIYDTVEDETLIFRDRMGIKPLYFYQNNNQIAFASELKSIAFLSNSIDKSALKHFLYLGYIPAPYSIYKYIEKFKSGHWGIIKNNSFTQKAYWSLEEQVEKDTLKNEEIAKKQFLNLINKSVEYRLISDVPVGCFLSGGIDSSLVTAVAQHQNSASINTFSIGFKENERNELGYAQQVANHLGTNHHEFILEQEQALEIVNRIIEMYDEPFADQSCIPTKLVSHHTKKHATVALSGDGGDELFMGYGFYNWAKRLNNPFVKTFRKPISQVLKQTNNQKLERGANVLNYPTEKHKKSHIFSQDNNVFSHTEVEQLTQQDFTIHLKEEFTTKRKLNALEEQALFDMQYYLQDNLLVKVDRASMAESLEVRVPFLDHEIVHFALNLDESLKRKNGKNKYLLLQVLENYFPSHFFDRKKQGFSIPIEKWLKKELKQEIDFYLSEEKVKEYGQLNWLKVKEYLTSFYLENKDFLALRIWTLYCLQRWLSSYYHKNV